MAGLGVVGRSGFYAAWTVSRLSGRFRKASRANIALDARTIGAAVGINSLFIAMIRTSVPDRVPSVLGRTMKSHKAIIL